MPASGRGKGGAKGKVSSFAFRPTSGASHRALREGQPKQGVRVPAPLQPTVQARPRQGLVISI